MEIRDKVAVITGAASGIGYATALELARRGCKAILMVDLTDQVETNADQVNAELGRDVAFAFRGNVTDPAFRQEVFDAARDRFGLVSICIPAAGITRDDLAVRLDKATGKAQIYEQERFQLVIDVNLIAPVYWSLEMVARIAEDRFAGGLRSGTPTKAFRAPWSSSGRFRPRATRGRSPMPRPRPASRGPPRP
ncbi:SDR family NAD(P)-dependent oxidoreductase [Marinobacterium aestuariivivens]|uniref:SDR family NAD(P)-dependent oxidoreductase n=1 Tax=Marinobacterium aestuariivivens TaxID=1698799 RepID=A0ABW2A649_9GAMM